MFPGEREIMDVSGRGCSCSSSCFTCDDVHELHVRLQTNTATASLQRMWKGKTSVPYIIIMTSFSFLG